ncbi:hypothetical protein T484DRAFT_1620446, partial [Baffinella frigidus]
LHPAPCTLHPAPCTLPPTPYTLHPTPCILHPAPYTVHPAPHTLHPTPYTLHPAPYTQPRCGVLDRGTTLPPRHPCQPPPAPRKGTDRRVRASWGLEGLWLVGRLGVRGVRGLGFKSPALLHVSTFLTARYRGDR